MGRCALLLGLLLPTTPSAVRAQPDPIVETGFQVGTALGTEGPHFSRYQGILDAGFLITGTASSPVRFGVTGYAALGDDDLLVGLKSRVRINYSRDWSTDIGVGAILFNAEGGSSVERFIANHSLNHGWLSLRVETTVRHFPELRRLIGSELVILEEGWEVGVYGGGALRKTPGWIGAAVGVTAALLYYGIDLIANPPS